MRILVVTSEWPEAHRPHSGPWVAQEVHFLREAGVEVDVVAFRGARRARNYLDLRRRVRERLESSPYDLVHAHFGHTAFAILPLDRPLVVTFHGSDLLGIVGRRGRPTPAGWLVRRLGRAAARRAAHVVVVSENLVPRLPRGVEYTINPMGVDLDLFRPRDRLEARRRLGLAPSGRYVLFSGSPSVPIKRFGLAKRAVELAGGAELLAVEGRPHEEIPVYMNACDVLLVTSLRETGPVTVKEALASNLPVVSLDVGDVRRWIGGLEGCEICRRDDPATIAAALRRVLARPTPFDGRSVAERELDARRLALRVLGVYERVLRARAAPTR